MKKINIRGICGRAILHHFNNNNVVVMQPITKKVVEDIENQLENSKNLYIHLRNNIRLTQSEVILYGEINTDDDNDKKLLESCENKIWDWTTWNHIAYSEIDYETGDVYQNESRKAFLNYSMCDIVKWIKYNLLLINNPEYIIIYRIPKNWL